MEINMAQSTLEKLSVPTNEYVFFHVQIELKRTDKKGKNIKYCELDITDRSKIIRSFVAPFLQNKEFRIDGHFVSKKEIDRFLIKSTKKSTEELADYINSHKPAELALIFVLRSDIPNYEKYALDVTEEFYKEAEELINEETTQYKDSSKSNELPCKVFIVHGHDNAVKQEVARFVEKLGFTAIILSEQPNEGMTIIEKLEHYTNVGFGIVLYTSCDEGRECGTKTLNPRARQNVVFEHGLLIGKIGRNRVHALKVDDLETPNDISGVVYTPMDKHGGWKAYIAKEMEHCGYKIDWAKFASA